MKHIDAYRPPAQRPKGTGSAASRPDRKAVSSPVQRPNGTGSAGAARVPGPPRPFPGAPGGGILGSSLRPAAGRLRLAAFAFACALLLGLPLLGGCSQGDEQQDDATGVKALEVSDVPYEGDTEEAGGSQTSDEGDAAKADANADAAQADTAASDAEALRAQLNITEDYRESFVHGEKGAAYQKYIMLHDTEGDGDGASVVSYWDGNGAGVAAHFIVNKDGSIVQCVPLDKIAHHAGFGDTGHNALYGVEDESRDDKVGTTSIGSWASDYGMNSYSIGIELVHVGGSGDYPEAQLEALDALIAYIDAYYGFESQIIDHKAWRTGNSDTSPEFATYLASYQEKRTHA